ncbi:NAD(P)-dependent oxidoreductase [Arenicella chitinivorans]|uniref:NAD(P)-dependent oxidoreductase n=1 Tax=Arenicella chitinivorans TaxID=1329800 RepID=A0A918RZ66_9GAMM|nr:SDR family NAD(P)-dependent oxidoreductase [Arenicella chitinivorans]GHA14481.1 NAD(P)-dependent oxidoreductase [Arenicella chitinivorans]
MTSKTAFITGASVGIGRATANVLADQGYQLVLLARRAEKLDALAAQLSTPVHIIACDINDHAAVDAALHSMPEIFRNPDVLVNNAGLALGIKPADQTDWLDWQTMIQTNCLSLAYLTRKILPSMVERNQGHIINLGSIAGRYPYQGGNVYGATKAFVEQFSRNLRTDVLGKQIRVTNLSPGIIGNTEFSLVRLHGDESAANAVYDSCQALTPEDIAECIRWAVTLPAHVNINEIEVMPTCQAAGGLAIARD